MSNQNRQGGGSRNRGGRNRQRRGNSSRNRGPRKPKAPPKATIGQKILQVLTFGLAGKPSENQNTGRPKQVPRGSALAGDSSSGSGSGANQGQKRSGGRSAKKKGSRPPRLVEPTTPRLYVGNLSFDAEESDLEELFKGIGTVTLAEIVTNQRTQRSKGYGFVEMLNVDEAKRASETLHDKDFMGRPLVVTGAKSTGPKTADSA